MARRPVLVRKPARVHYHVVRPVPDGHLGGIAVKGGRVLMSPAEAKFWIDQGVLSTASADVLQQRRAQRVTGGGGSPQVRLSAEGEDPGDRLSRGSTSRKKGD